MSMFVSSSFITLRNVQIVSIKLMCTWLNLSLELSLIEPFCKMFSEWYFSARLPTLFPRQKKHQRQIDLTEEKKC